MEKIKNLSIRKSIVLYMGIAVTASFLLSMLCIWSAHKVQQNIWRKYTVPEKNKLELYTDDPGQIIYDFPRTVERISDDAMSSSDAFKSNICDFVDTWCIAFISMACCVISTCLFYGNKIKVPLELLEDGSKKISAQCLDFQIRYDRTDEMGRLCAEFEAMRQELEHNNKKMWRMIENEKIMRGAVTHDISSPLAIIKGYQETLKVFIPLGKLSEEKMLEIVESCLKQVDRLDQFVKTMKQLSGIEERTVKKEKISLSTLCRHMEDTVIFLTSPVRIGYQFLHAGEREIYADQNMIYEVFENILSNALRYARKEITVKVNAKDCELEIYVEDDGEGFGEHAKEMVKAFVHDGTGEDGVHFGLGLYICDVFCKRHGGELCLNNSESGGAGVRAKFKVD
jgi:signal transduction histidine kinase